MLVPEVEKEVALQRRFANRPARVYTVLVSIRVSLPNCKHPTIAGMLRV